MNGVFIDIQKFLDQFNKEYAFLYDHHDNVAGFQEAVEFGDDFLPKHKEFVSEFCNYRGDFLLSDREIAAFMFALDSMGAI